MIRPKYHPAGKSEANIEKEGTDEESKHVWSSPLHGENKDVVGFEEAEVSQDSKPDEAVARAQHEAAHVPHVAHDGPALDELLDDGAHDDQAVVGADHHIPQVEELAALLHSEHPVVVAAQEDHGLVFEELSAQQGAQTEQQRAQGQTDHKQVQEHDEGGVHGGPRN